jgi:hypothetical protein
MRRIPFLLLAMHAFLVPAMRAQSVRGELLVAKSKDSRVQFHATARHVAWVVVSGVSGLDFSHARRSLFLDGKAVVTDPDGIFGPVYSPDGAHYAWVLRRGNELTLFVDGEARGPVSISPLDFLELRPPTRTRYESHIPSYRALSPRPLSPDGKHFAWRNCAGNSIKDPSKGCPLLRDGEVVGQGVLTFQFLADGKLLSESVDARGKEWSLAIDGKEIVRAVKAWEKVFSPFRGLTLSPDYKRFACVGWRVPVIIGQGSISEKNGTKTEAPIVWEGYSMIVDGKVDTPAKGVRPPVGFGLPVFSPDGTRLAYVIIESAEKKGFWDTKHFDARVKVDDSLGQSFHSVWSAFSRNEPTPSFVLQLGSGLLTETYPLLTGVVDPDWYGVGTPVFSPDSKRVAYAAKRGAKDFVIVLDGKIQEWPHAEHILTGPVFSPDSEHLVYLAQDGGLSMVVVDGVAKNKEPANTYNFAESLTYTPQGKPVYVAGIGGDSYRRRETNKARRRVVVDGVAGKEYNCDAIENLLVSPDGKHVAYTVLSGSFLGKKTTVVLDGQEGKPYDDFFPDSMRFTEGASLTYIAGDERGYFRVTHSVE